MPEAENGDERIEIGRGKTYVRISGRDAVIIVILAVALGYIVWNTTQGDKAIIHTIEAVCAPRYAL